MARNNEKKDIQGMLKDTVVLLVITVISGLVLGFVYNLTKEPIAVQQELKIQKTCAKVYETAQNFEEINIVPSQKTLNAMADAGYAGAEIGTAYAAGKADGTLLGYVITVTTHEGYGGDITFMMGVDLEGTVMGVSILNTSETPGLGRNAQKKLVPQFTGKNVAAFEYTKNGEAAGNQVDALTGATITTKAVTNGVNAGLIFFREDLDKGGKEG